MDEKNQFSAHQRRLKIVQQIQEQGSIRVAELIQEFGVSDTAIRRDLNILEERKLVQRIHGGALAVPRLQAGSTFAAKSQQQIQEKSCIGQVAASMIQPGESILLDSGTTVLEVALAIPKIVPGHPPLTIVTHSIPVMLALQEWNASNLNLLGGILLTDYQATVGPQTIANLRRIQVAKAFIGCDGLTLSHGLTTPHMLVAEVGRAMVEVASEVIVVTDSSKLGRVGFTQIVPLNRVHTLITDDQAAPEIVEQIREAGIQVILAPIE
jgi:DeoR/GlpR family transcriptional regulator of sugar metabolism